jgi:hypothetical protein
MGTTVAGGRARTDAEEVARLREHIRLILREAHPSLKRHELSMEQRLYSIQAIAETALNR